MLNTWKADRYNSHNPYNDYTGTQDQAFLLAHWFPSAFYQYQLGHS